jgi:hypothetical protein
VDIFQFLNLYIVGRTPWTGDQPVSRPLSTHRTTQTQNKRTQTSMPLVGFEPTISVFEWAKTVSCLRAAAHRLHQDKRQKKQKLTSASWLRPLCGRFHNLIRFNCAPFFASCRRHRVLTVICLDACRCAAYQDRAATVIGFIFLYQL